MLVFVLAALLCCLYASDTIIISYCYRVYAHNPSSAKLLLLSEALKLLIASCLYFTEQKPSDGHPEECHRSLLSDAESLPAATASSSHAVVSQQPRWGRIWRPAQQFGWTLLVFSIPSLCYFGTNNLSFYALTLMSAHLYTLLCDLKIISTGILNYLILDKRLNRHAVLSLVALFLGICIGQYSTMRGSAGSLTTLTAASHFKVGGFLLMALISLISGIASVYTEWVMNHSQYRHESLNLQNMRLYSIGMALNAAYYWQNGGRLEGFLSDMSGPYWAVVLILALMGLITGVIIKHYGNIVKVYASSIASLFAAWVSQVLLKDPPPPLFYAGVFLAMAATVQLQKARSSLTGSSDGGPHKSPRRPGQTQQQHQRIRASLVVPVALAVLVLVFVPQMVPWGRDWGNGRQGQAGSRTHAAAVNGTVGAAAEEHLPANLNNPASLVPRGGIDGPMPALPPFEPTCLVRFEDRHLLGCRPLNCSLDATCTAQDKRCCAYFKVRMLDDVDRLLHLKGLQGQYTLVYGSALGAARNQTVLGNVDVALSPTAIQVIAQNSTREQLWRKGYVVWHDRDLFHVCPHDLHPAYEFRAAVVHNTTHQQWEVLAKRASTVHMRGFLMWQQPAGPASCAAEAADPKSTAEAAIMMQPLAPTASAAARAAHSPHEQVDSQLQQAEDGRPGAPASADLRTFCLQQSTLPITIQPSERLASIAGMAFPAPHNLEEHLAHTYGAGWADPNASSDAVTQKTPDWWHIQQALLARLSVTTWGDTPWSERINRCAALQAAKTAAGTVELGGSPRTNAVGQLQGAQTVQQPGQLRQHVLQEAGTSGEDQQQRQHQQHTAEVHETLIGQQRPDAEQQEQQQEHWQLLQQLKAQDDDDFDDDNAAAGEGRGQHQQELLQDDMERDQWEDRQQQQQHQHQHKRSMLRQML